MLACNVMIPPDDDTEMETTDWRDCDSEPDVIYRREDRLWSV